MRILSLLTLAMMAVINDGQARNPFLTLKFDKVVFYDFKNEGEKRPKILDMNGRPQLKIIKQVELEATTIRMLGLRLGDKKSNGSVTAFCFDPHCGFVYFLHGKPVAQILICIDCNRLSSDLDIPAQKQGKQGSGKNAYYIADGMSKIMRKFLNNLLVKNGFTHTITPGSAFDQ